MNLRATLTAGVLAAATLRAQTPRPSADDGTVKLEPVTVQGSTVPDWLDAAPDRLEWSLPVSLAAGAETVPGLVMHHMGAAAAEPLLRGLGSDHVVTVLDGLPLPNASPTRTDSALALIAAGLPAGFEAVKALPSVTLGPPATAGYLELSTEPDPTHAAYRTYAGASWMPDRAGSEALATASASDGAWTARFAAAAHRLGDYTSGDGTVVPAADRNAGAAIHLDWRPNSRQGLHLGALYSRQLLAVNSALPLDTRDTDTTAFTAGYDWSPSERTQFATRFGVGVIRPHLDNTGRPAPARVAADGRTGSLAAGIVVRHRTDRGDEIAAGVDATQEDRRLERKRPGAIDLLWPDLRQQDLGAFAQLTHPLTPDWKLRLGARVDAADSEARAADGLAFGRVIRALYAAYDGPAASQTSRSETAGAANALLTGKLAPNLTTTLGAGFTRQPPGASERYRAFSDALGGGYEIGNPSADAEDKYELDWGVQWRRRRFTVSVDAFADHLPNYLHRTRVGVTSPPAPPPPGSIVYGYRAIKARFQGAEIEALWQPAEGTWWRMAASSVEGVDEDAHRQLPEIPPAALTCAVGHRWTGAAGKPWIEAGGRFVAAQRNPAPDDMPVFADTAAFGLGRIRAGLSWHEIRLSLSIDNAFNRQYYDYLSPPAGSTPAGGTLIPGTRVPGPGRSVTLTVTWALR
jgi:iron complex outermembrane recepter protein